MLKSHIEDTKKEFDKEFNSGDDEWTGDNAVYFIKAFIEKRERILADSLKKELKIEEGDCQCSKCERIKRESREN